MKLSLLKNPLLVLAAATLMAALSLGLRHSFGLYLRPMSEAFGWGREVFSFAMAVQIIVWGISQPVMGALADRFGSGRVLATGGLLYATGLYLMSMAATPTLLVLVMGVIIALGVSAASFALALGAVSRVVDEKKRSMYLGIVMSGGSFGLFVVVPITQGFISQLGWAGALQATAVLALLMVVLAMLLTGKADHRQDASTDAPAPVGVSAAVGPVHALRMVGKQKRYWLLFWGFFVCGFHVAFIATHLPAYLTDQGISPGIAAMALSLIGLFNIVGTLTFGYLGGRISKRKSLSWIYFSRSIVIGLLLLLPMSNATALGFASAIGLLWIATVPLTSGLVGQMYGVRYLSTLFGMIFLGHQIGGFLGVWLGGWLFDSTGSYQVVWLIGIGLGLFAALIHWPIDERSEEERGVDPAINPEGNSLATHNPN